MVCLPIVSAGTGIHRGHETEIRRVDIGGADAGDTDDAVFEGLAQHFQSVAIKFGEFT